MTRVLIVDDATFTRKMLRMILEKNNCEVVGEAGDGISALQQISTLKPDIVTLDITMPKMDGLECLAKMKELDHVPQVVMITSLGQKSKLLDAINKGARTFIVKPFQEETIVSMLNRLMI